VPLGGSGVTAGARLTVAHLTDSDNMPHEETTIADLGLPRRIASVLDANGVNTLDELLARNERELLALPGLGAGSLRTVTDTLGDRGLHLAADPWAPYECARHGVAQWDVTLCTHFLCDECSDAFATDSFGGEEPAFVGAPHKGRCSHCNLVREIRIRQWLLCTWCDRVLRSLGRSIASSRFVMETWAEQIAPQVPSIELRGVDEPRLVRRDADTIAAKVASVDFEGVAVETGELLLAIELKTGKSYISGEAIGSRMGTFQLDQSDCDDITTVAERDGVPVYLFHAQVIDRVEPPTVRFAPVAFWWTHMFAMRDHFVDSRTRPRETKIAAYYSTTMFGTVPELVDHLQSDGPARLKARIANEGLPQLY
jgi:hypothetical protein